MKQATWPVATPAMPSRGKGPRPSPSAPPTMICTAAAMKMVVEGIRMLPEPRTIDASVLVIHTPTMAKP